MVVYENTYNTSKDIATKDSEGFHDCQHIGVMCWIIRPSLIELSAAECDGSHAITLVLRPGRVRCVYWQGTTRPVYATN